MYNAYINYILVHDTVMVFYKCKVKKLMKLTAVNATKSWSNKKSNK